MPRLLALIAAVTGALLTAGSPRHAAACSLAHETFLPTNFELVQAADAIVAATAIASEGKDFNASLTFRVDRTLKGAPPTTLTFPARQLGRTEPSDPQELLAPHPESLEGGCVRRTFAKGGHYLLFLLKTDGDWILANFAFTRSSEDTTGPEGLWERTVGDYVAIQRDYPAGEQTAALKALLRKRLDGPRTRDAHSQALDLYAGLHSVSPWRQTADLMDAFTVLRRGEAWEPFALSSDERRWLFPKTDALASSDDDTIRWRKRMSIRALVALTKEGHEDAAPLFERIAADPASRPRELGLAIRFFAGTDLRRAYALMIDRGVATAEGADREDGEGLISDMQSAMGGRWRADPEIAGAWPELALRLYWFQRRTWGLGGMRSFGDALKALPLSDYRARPELTLALAADDDAIAAWAAAQLTDSALLAASTAADPAAEDPALLPLQALLQASGDDRDATIRQVFCQSPRRRALLLKTFGEWNPGYDRDIWVGMALSSVLTTDERVQLGKSAVAAVERGDQFADAVADAYTSGEPLDIERERRFWPETEAFTCPPSAPKRR